MVTCHACGHDYEDGTLFCVHDGTPLKTDLGDLPEGTEVGEYRITHKLGQGAMGSVFAGVHPLIGKRVAIKVLNHDLCRDASMVQRFVQEARAVNRIGHPNIIDVFAFGTLPDGRHYYVMEHLEGNSLAGVLEERRLTVSESRRLLGQLCEGLAAAHAEGIIHRDLKPDNIFVAMPKHGESFVKVLDFGIAKLFSAEEAMTATRTGMPVGTPYYMSPEQIRASKNIDHRTDIYALGVIMFEIFTGRVPFPRETVFEVFADHVGTMPPRPSSLSPLPGALDDLILRCLAKNPADRPQSARDVGQALLKLLAPEASDGGGSGTLPYGAVPPTPGALAAAAVTVPVAGTGAESTAGFDGVAASAGHGGAPPTGLGAATVPAVGFGATAPPAGHGAAAAPAASHGGATAATAASQPGMASTAAAAVTAPPRRSRLGLIVGLVAAVVVVAGVAVALGTRSGNGGGRAAAPGDDAVVTPGAGPERRAPDAAPRRTGTLRITTDVGVARFFLDGKNVAEGKTATLTDVTAGVHHELRAEAAGEPPQVLRVLVSEGGESVVEVTFHGAAKPGATPPPARPGAKGGGPHKATPPVAKVPEAPKAPKPPTKKALGRDDIAEPF